MLLLEEVGGVGVFNVGVGLGVGRVAFANRRVVESSHRRGYVLSGIVYILQAGWDCLAIVRWVWDRYECDWGYRRTGKVVNCVYFVYYWVYLEIYNICIYYLYICICMSFQEGHREQVVVLVIPPSASG